ncbi:MAG: hypothetical protein M0R37_12800 [Bacteroidales bacterium]|nr:hypothetical protein [Bacteroidales bacterium]
MGQLPPNGDPVSRAELGWLERLLKSEIKSFREHVDTRIDGLEGKLEDHMPYCAARFVKIENRLDAPGRWFRGRLTRAFDSLLGQGVKLASLAVLILLGIHAWPF